MRLRRLFEMRFEYAEPVTMIFPFGEKVGQGYGGGDGTIEGEALQGTVRWSNWPIIREDRVAIPNLTGTIHSDDGARILFQIGGFTVPDLENQRRTIVGSSQFMSDHPDYAWMNTACIVHEGWINVETAAGKTQFFQCVPDW
jgi:hypothetical protein